MTQISVIYPIFTPDQNLALAFRGLQSQSYKNFEIITLLQVELNELAEEERNLLVSEDRVKLVPGRYKNIAQMMNRGFEVASGDLLVYLPPNIEIEENLLADYQKALDENKKAAFVYADYWELYPDGHKQLKKLRNYDGDITERANFGYVKGYRKTAVQQLGGYDESLNRAEEYDLRLKLSDCHDLVRIPYPLYNLYISPQAAEEKKANVGASKLFFPGEGKYGGFSYLFYDEEEEREIEEAFYRMLKRHNAFLSHENTQVKYNPDDKFSPTVSVIIPVYNRVKFIGRTIESVLQNSFQDFEIIIVDNGSTDGTIELVERYARDSKVRLIKNKKNVIAYSLNLGIKNARGKYISQLDSDDEYTPETLEAMVDHLETHPKCALAISYYELIDESDNVLEEFGIIKHLEYNRNNILRVDGAGAVRMWHKKVIEEFGLFDERRFGHYGEDYDLVLKVSEKYDVDRVHQVLYRYRRHPDNTDVKRDPEMKIANKTLARTLALERRKQLNEKLARGESLW